jgi:allantoate deiminase
VRLLEDTAGDLGIPAMLLHSGAGHDSQIMSRIARVAMIFVRSEGGRSHTPEEFTSVDDAVAGIRILAASLYKLAY